MNTNHAQLCPSPEWAEHIQTDILPTLFAGVAPDARMLEIGPGPGATTDWLRSRVGELVAVEIDPVAADLLRERFDDVQIVTADATALPFPDACFDVVGAFTMLHHVPTPRLQNAVLAEALRVLRPGGVLLASDSLPSTGLHEFHVDDTYCPIEPATIVARLQTIGFGHLHLDVGHWWSVRAHRDEMEAAA